MNRFGSPGWFCGKDLEQCRNQAPAHIRDGIERIGLSASLLATIYGTHTPDGSYRRLIKLVDYLQNNGFPRVATVAQWPLPGLEAYDKSLHYLEVSHFNILIHFIEDLTRGIHVETYATLERRPESALMCLEIDPCIPDSYHNVSSILTTHPRFRQARVVKFPRDNDQYLHKQVESFLWERLLGSI